MKKLFTVLTALLISSVLFAPPLPVPQKMSYQAVIRNSSNVLVTNQQVGMKTSILQGSATGTAVYVEIYNPNYITNANGLVTVEIGGGIPLTGTFSTINWATGPYFIKTETDPAGGTNYTITATSELLSVPYALHAKTVQTGDNWGTDIVKTDATLAGNGTAAIPLKLAQQSATTGQALKWNGSTWAPANDATSEPGFSLPYKGTISTTTAGFRVENTDNTAIEGVTSSSSTNGVRGVGYIGVSGESSSATGYGVYGYETSFTGLTSGVMGVSASNNGNGVYGLATSTEGENYGVFGRSVSSSGKGVYGLASSTVDNTYGVYGESASSSGVGVKGIATSSATGLTFGVFGESNSSSGRGVCGWAKGNSISNIGVFGRSDNGDGVFGNSVTGAGIRGSGRIGVEGGGNAEGYSGYFTVGRFYVQGFVGLGDMNPDCKLVVKASNAESQNMIAVRNPSNENLVLMRQNSTGEGSVNIYDNANSCTTSLIGGGYNSYINYNNSYNLGIGTNAPTQKLDINGNVRVRSIGSGAYAGVVNRMADGTLTTATSDVRLKENIHSLNGCLNKVMQLRGVSFTWKTDPGMGERIGFVAQEFEKVIPELVFTNPVDSYKGINYAEVSAVLVEAIKELKSENDRLKGENTGLKTEVSKINTRLEKNEVQLTEVENRINELMKTK